MSGQKFIAWRLKRKDQPMLTKRQNHIIDILNSEHRPVTGKELGKILGVSDRTIRTDVEGINSEYACKLILANRRSGYQVDYDLMKQHNIERKEAIPQTALQRRTYLIRELLFRKKEINLLDLQERIFVSGYSIDNDIKKLRELIGKYPGLKLERSKNHLRLSGDEGDKRRLYKELLLEELKDNFVNLSAIAGIWNDFDLLEVGEEFLRICKKHGYRISELEYPCIMLHAGVSMERMLNHDYISTAREQETVERGEREYDIAEELFFHLSQVYKVKRTEEEIHRFAGFLKGCGTRENETEGQEAQNRILMEQIYEVLQNEFDLDLSADEEFRRGFLSHIRRLARRQESTEEIEEWYLQELRGKYPLFFEMAVRVSERVRRVCGFNLEEAQLSFLALYLGSACQRLNMTAKYRVVLIIPNSHLISRSCVDKLLLRFGERISVTSVYSFFEERQILRDMPDLILSAMPLKHPLDVPTLQISLFLNSEDESRIFQLLNHLDKMKYHRNFVTMMERLMRKELFHISDSLKSREEIIDYLCHDLYEKGLSEENFRENVMHREEMSATSFVHGFAVPHATEISGSQSCISILLLREPVKWGNFHVRLVILLAIRESDNQLLRVFFDWLCNLVTDNKMFEKLVHANDYEEFKQLCAIE